MAISNVHNLVSSLGGITNILKGGALLVAIYVLLSGLQAVWNAYYGPLSKFPGPKLYALSTIPKVWNSISGRNHIAAQELHSKYGPVVRVAPNELSYCGDAQVWNDIYGFKKAGNPKPRKDPEMYRAEFNGSHSLISANDKDHARQRKVLAHAFSDRVMREQEPILKQWVGKLLRNLSVIAADKTPTNMLKNYNCTTFDVMGDLTFSENLHMLDKGELSPWVETIFASIKFATILGSVAMLHSWLRYLILEYFFRSAFIRKKQWEHWNYTHERLERRLARTDIDRPDFWAKILSKGSGSDLEGGISVGERHANASLFMMAGTETTATALTGTTFHVLSNPRCLKKLQDEIRGAFSTFEDVTLYKMTQLKYLQACLSEGLRMYPPVPVTMFRQTPPDGCVVAGEYVPGKVSLGIHHLATHLSPDNFARPTEFHPERWLGEEGFENDKLDSIEPFSFGPRNCLGKNLAWHEMRLILCSVMLHYDLKLEANMKTWNQQKVYSLWEKVPLMCTLTTARPLPQ